MAVAAPCPLGTEEAIGGETRPLSAGDRGDDDERRRRVGEGREEKRNGIKGRREKMRKWFWGVVLQIGTWRCRLFLVAWFLFIQQDPKEF